MSLKVRIIFSDSDWKKVEITPEGAEKLKSLPDELQAEIFKRIESRERQQLRKVCNDWRTIIDNFCGIHVVATNLNWDWVEGNNYITSAKVVGLTRDIFSPCLITYNLKSLEIFDLIAYYSLFHLLEECDNLQSLTLQHVSFLSKSKLPEFTSPEYYDGSKKVWLPRLKSFKYVTHSPFLVADEIEQMDLGRRSRDESEFLPTIFLLLQHAPLENIHFILGDMWRISFQDLFYPLSIFEERVGNPDPSAITRLLPVSTQLPLKLLDKALNSIVTCRIIFPFRHEYFSLKFLPGVKSKNGLIPQLEEIVVQQFFRWGSAEGEKLDKTWIQILENQYFLKNLHYSFPISGNDLRMATILNNCSSTLQTIVFHGYREKQLDLDTQYEPVMRQQLPWDGNWFTPCKELIELTFLPVSKAFFPIVSLRLINPQLLPKSLKKLNLIGTIDTGNLDLPAGLNQLENLEELEFRVRKFPWIVSNETKLNVFNIQTFSMIMKVLPKLTKLNLIWSEEPSHPGYTVVPSFTPATLFNNAGTNLVTQSLVPTGICPLLKDWLKQNSQDVKASDMEVDASAFQLRDLGLAIHLNKERESVFRRRLEFNAKFQRPLMRSFCFPSTENLYTKKLRQLCEMSINSRLLENCMISQNFLFD